MTFCQRRRKPDLLHNIFWLLLEPESAEALPHTPSPKSLGLGKHFDESGPLGCFLEKGQRLELDLDV